MAYSLKIKSVKEDTVVESGEAFLDVLVEVQKGGKNKSQHRFGFPVGTPQKQIEKELTQFRKNLENEDKRAEDDKEVEAKRAESQKVITNLTGKEL